MVPHPGALRAPTLPTSGRVNARGDAADSILLNSTLSRVGMRQTESLFNHLVGAPNERVGDVKAERLGGLEVDVQLNFGCLLDRQFGGLVALENPAGVDARQAVCFCNVRSITQQTAGRSELAMLESYGHGVANRQRGELFAMTNEKWSAGDHKPAGPQLDQLCKDS